MAACAIGLAAASTSPVRAYGTGRLSCRLSDPRITESSGVASTSWADGVIWTHNDSGDKTRFFAVDAATCNASAVYEVAGARALDWEDMARSGTTLHFGDIGDNDRKRASVTIYDVPEPAQGAPSGTVRPSTTRVLRYPDGPHDAESLFVDPVSGRLAIVTKAAAGEAAAYLAPLEGNGVMEKAAAVPVASATAADASGGRVVVRDYVRASEWVLQPGETLAGVLSRPSTPIALPLTVQGEAIAYARDSSGLWTTAEGRSGPIHFVPDDDAAPPTAAGEPVATQADKSERDGSGDRLVLAMAIGVPAALGAALLAWVASRRRR